MGRGGRGQFRLHQRTSVGSLTAPNSELYPRRSTETNVRLHYDNEELGTLYLVMGGLHVPDRCETALNSALKTGRHVKPLPKSRQRSSLLQQCFTSLSPAKLLQARTADGHRNKPDKRGSGLGEPRTGPPRLNTTAPSPKQRGGGSSEEADRAP